MDEARARISRLRLSAGSYVEFSGTVEAQAQSRRDLLMHSLLAGLGIILLLSMVTGSRRNLLLVLSNLPFALVGGVSAALLHKRRVRRHRRTGGFERIDPAVPQRVCCPLVFRSHQWRSRATCVDRASEDGGTA